MASRETRRLVSSRRTATGCLIWRAMSGNGPRIGSAPGMWGRAKAHAAYRTIRHADDDLRIACFALHSCGKMLAAADGRAWPGPCGCHNRKENLRCRLAAGTAK